MECWDICRTFAREIISVSEENMDVETEKVTSNFQSSFHNSNHNVKTECSHNRCRCIIIFYVGWKIRLFSLIAVERLISHFKPSEVQLVIGSNSNPVLWRMWKLWLFGFFKNKMWVVFILPRIIVLVPWFPGFGRTVEEENYIGFETGLSLESLPVSM